MLKQLLVNFIFCIIPLISIAGGGWIQAKGEGYFKLSQQWAVYNEYYNEDGNILTDRTRSLGSTAVYFEYGILERFNLVAYVPFFRKATIFEQQNSGTGSVIREGEQFSSIGDIDLTLKFGILRNSPVVLSTSLTLGLPVGQTRKGSDESLQTGDGEFNQLLRLDAGGSFKLGSQDFYGTAYVGYNNRTEGFSDDVRYGLEIGWTAEWITLLLRANGVKSTYNGTLGEDLFFSGLLVNNTEYLIVSPELILGNVWGITFNYAKAVVGKLMFVQPSYTVGLYYTLK